MIKQKLIASAMTATVAMSGVAMSVEKFQHTKLEEVKVNFQKTETALKENEQKLVNKYQELYNTAKTNIQALEAENQKLKEQLNTNINTSTGDNDKIENSNTENIATEITE